MLNTTADDEGQAIIRHGNARVLRARFKDARFFWDFDQKIPLAERVESLKSVTFQNMGGTCMIRFLLLRLLASRPISTN